MDRFFEQTDLIDFTVEQYGKQAEALAYLPDWVKTATDRIYRAEFRLQLKIIFRKYKLRWKAERAAERAARKQAKLGALPVSDAASSQSASASDSSVPAVSVSVPVLAPAVVSGDTAKVVIISALPDKSIETSNE